MAEEWVTERLVNRQKEKQWGEYGYVLCRGRRTRGADNRDGYR